MPGGDAVRFAGNVYGARLASLFRNAALFVLPSDLEGLPIVLLEALCYEVPVLASDIPPNREVMDGMCATFKAGDIRDLQEKLGRCLSSADSLKAGARLAASRVACRYEWDAVTDETVSVYARVSNR